MKILIDTNVLLDVMARREPFYADSAKLWTLAEAGVVEGFASSLSLPDIYYLLRRHRGHKAARQALRILRDIFNLVPLDTQIINQAIDSDMTDFEDAIQFFSAARIGAVVLVTRNAQDFAGADIATQSPTEFLATHFQ